MRQWYASAPTLSDTEQQQLDKEMAMLGVTCRKEAEPEPVVFWDEHRSAIEWWLQVQDLLRWQGPVCEGLDVNAVKADAEMSGRTINADDYHRLKLISHTVKTLFNDRLKH